MQTQVLQEKIYNVHGTTKLNLYDEGFSQKGTNFEFFGNISAAPLGLLRIRKVHVICDADNYFPDGFEYDDYQVDVFQAKNEDVLQTYVNGQYYSKMIKKEYELNCETASFTCETKFGADTFHTGADGVYAELTQMKQYYGMILHFYFDDELFTFEELEQRFLALWKEKISCIMEREESCMKESAEKLVKFWLDYYSCDYYIANITEISQKNMVDFLINERGSMYHLTVRRVDNYMVVENEQKDVLLKIA